MFEKRPKLFKNRDVLSPLFVPDTLQDRKEEVGAISQYLGYILDGATPPHLLIVGPPGSGKTVTTKYVINELEKHTSDAVIEYIVADGTAYQVATSIARAPRRGLGFLNIVEKIRERASEGKMIIVMDEIDKTLSRDGDKLLYHLSREPNVCIVGLSNKLMVMDMIGDSGVISSFKPRRISFAPYSAPQLEEILNYRVEMAFNDGVLEDDVVPLCAALAAQRNGDARYALDLLSFAADIAIRQLKGVVSESDVRMATDEVEVEFIRRSIEQLRDNQKILLYAVMTSQGGTPTEIYRKYNKMAEEQFGGNALTQRRLSQLLRELELYGLVEIEVVGRGRGRGVNWHVVPSSSIDPDLMLEAIRRSL